MLFQFDVSGPGPMPHPPATPQGVPADAVELLRQILEVQKEHLALTRAIAIANDGGTRWRNFLSRWKDDYPDMATACKHVLPMIERAYLATLHDLTERLTDDPDGIDNEFALGEFLDRYGMKLGQLGQIINQMMPLAEAAVTPPPASKDSNSAGEGAD